MKTVDSYLASLGKLWLFGVWFFLLLVMYASARLPFNWGSWTATGYAAVLVVSFMLLHSMMWYFLDRETTDPKSPVNALAIAYLLLWVYCAAVVFSTPPAEDYRPDKFAYWALVWMVIAEISRVHRPLDWKGYYIPTARIPRFVVLGGGVGVLILSLLVLVGPFFTWESAVSSSLYALISALVSLAGFVVLHVFLRFGLGNDPLPKSVAPSGLQFAAYLLIGAYCWEIAFLHFGKQLLGWAAFWAMATLVTAEVMRAHVVNVLAAKTQPVGEAPVSSSGSPKVAATS